MWPENWPAFLLFSRLQTQWLAGFNGRTGLNYLVLFAVMERMKLSESDHNALFDDIQKMEFSALEEMNSGEPNV